jgi:hypothetical protein
MFLQGEILKSKERSDKYPKFVMVLFDPHPVCYQFNAVILFCKNPSDEYSEDEQAGYVANNFNTIWWERTNWEEIKRWL